MKRSLPILICSLLIICLKSYSQGEIDASSKILLRNETSISAGLTNNGYGLGYRYGKHKWAKIKMLYQADLFLTKHPKEIKSSSYYFPQKSFVYGKVNTLFNLHLGYGIQQEIFSREDVGGVAIRYLITGGPTFAFLKPNYYQVTYVVGEYVVEDFDTFFDNSAHAGIIIGDASFFKGFGETRIVPGLFIQAGINFDYNQSDEVYNALEAGLMLDVYMNKLPIMSENLVPASPFLLQTYLCYRFGRIRDGGN